MIELNEAAKKLHIADIDKWVEKVQKSSNIQIFYEEDSAKISNEDFYRISRNISNKLPYNAVIPKGYLSRNEAIEKYKISFSILRHHQVSGYFETIRIFNIVFIKISQLEKLKKSLQEISNLEKNNLYIKVSDLINENYYGKVQTILRRNSFEGQVKNILCGKKKVRFITKKLLEEILDGKYNIINNNRDAMKILPSDADEIIERLKNRPYEYNVGEKAKLKDKINIKEINKKIDLGKIELEDKRHYLYEYEIEYLMLRNEYFPLRIISKITKITKSTLTSNFNIARKYKKLNYIEINNRIYLDEESLRVMLYEYSKKYISTLSVDRIEEERKKLLPDKNPITLELAKEFIKSKKKNFKKKEYGEDPQNFVRLLNSIEVFILQLDDEVFKYNSDELLSIISDKTKVKAGYMPNICQFLNFIKRKKKSKCKYTKQFGKSLINQYLIEGEKKEEDRIYSKEVWGQYYLILRDSSRHINNSIDNIKYSQCWLYCILNLSITWRRKNILLSLPRINLDEIGVNDFNWFREKNEFTLDMANKILEQIKFSLDGVIAFKNKRNLHFNIPLSLKIPTAIAYVLSEIHCRINNEKLILYEIIKKDITKSDLKRIFKDDNLLDFKNLKCTRSIMTYGYSFANNVVGTTSAAYRIYSTMRSHTNPEQRLNNVTGNHYLVLNSQFDGIKDYMFNIAERGAFGFLYYKLFQCICDIKKDEFDNLKQDELTGIIKIGESIINPRTLENICSNLIDNKDINELNLFEVILLNSIVHSMSNNIIKNYEEIFFDNIIQVYKNKAKELFGSSDKFDEFIYTKYKYINNYIDKLKLNKNSIENIFKEVISGSLSCYSEYTNCIFDKIERKELCKYNYGASGGASCLGCENNLLSVYALYEVSDKLKMLLDKIDKKIYMDKNEIIKDSYIIKNYLGIIVEALTHFKDETFIKNIVDIRYIKKKIIRLRNEDKIYNF